jgi:SRSO17 transposase
MDGASSGRGLAAITPWSEAWADLRGRIGRRFARAEARERAGRYLAGLLGRVERKNGWQLAEAMGEVGPRGVQRLLSAAVWDADGVRDDLRGYVVDHLGDEASGVLIVDETGFLKKGRKSCGVARQDPGTAGDIVNCQVGVLLAYASRAGAAFIDRALYLPQEWAEDRTRRAEAGVPEATVFATKIDLAQRMLARAFDAGVPARWVVGDAFYGRSHELRRWLEEQGRAYALMIPKTNAVGYQGRRALAGQFGERLCSEPALGSWACLELSEECAAGLRRWLLVRCDAEDPNEHAYFLACGPEETGIEELVRVCRVRWQIEECLAEAKGEVGLDQYEARKWYAWHRHATLCLLAHAYRVVMRQAARREEAGAGEKGAPIPA